MDKIVCQKNPDWNPRMMFVNKSEDFDPGNDSSERYQRYEKWLYEIPRIEIERRLSCLSVFSELSILDLRSLIALFK